MSDERTTVYAWECTGCAGRGTVALANRPEERVAVGGILSSMDAAHTAVSPRCGVRATLAVQRLMHEPYIWLTGVVEAG